jgi:hypothetical protein
VDATAQALLKVIEYLVFKDLGLGVLYAGIAYILVYALIRAHSSGTVSVPAVPAQPSGPVVTPPPIVIPPPGPPAPPATPLQSGKGSWYSQFQGKYSWVDTGDTPGSNALGVPDADQGISFYNKATLGQWFELHAPNGVVSTEQQTDIGPNPNTGRTIDISAACAERIGYSPSNFPTDGIFQWRSIPAPASVASLSPVQQAIAYAKLRGQLPVPTTPANPTGTPAWITLGRTFTANGGLVWTDGQIMPAQIQAWMDNIAARFPTQRAYVAALKALGARGYWEWCGGYVAAMLSYSGIPGPISAAGLQGQTTTGDWAYVDAWRPWGIKVWDAADGTDINDAPVQEGDVLIWKTPNIHHVSFYDHSEPDTNTFASLGGDQGSPLRVCIEDLPMSWCVAIRRPPAPGASA